MSLRPNNVCITYPFFFGKKKVVVMLLGFVMAKKRLCMSNYLFF